MKIVRGLGCLVIVLGGAMTACSGSNGPAEEQEKTGSVGSEVQLGTTKDQCSSDNLYVLNAANQYQYIPHNGLWQTVNLSGRRFTWLCDGSNEYTTCDIGTTYVKARHLVGSREIDWSCQASP